MNSLSVNVAGVQHRCAVAGSHRLYFSLLRRLTKLKDDIAGAA
jgi:hypothetical protein